MFRMRVLCTAIAIALMPGLAGCGKRIHFGAGFSRNVSEDRTLTAAHVPGLGIEIHTSIGSVEIVTEPSRPDVKVAAHVTAYGSTDDEAQARLQEIEIKLRRREDGVLEITTEPATEGQTLQGGCSFVVHAPEVNGVKVRTGNGAVTLKELAGAADVDTSIGAVAVTGHQGPVKVHTGNGAIQITRAAGAVRADTSIGTVTVKEAAGDVEAHSGNGAVTVHQAAGAVQVRTSIGTVTVREAAGQVEAKTGNGSITYTAAPGSNAAFNLETSIGSVAVRLPASVGGTIQAKTAIGTITVNGARQPRSVSGKPTAKQIVLTEQTPASHIHTGNGSITVTLD